MPFTSTTPVADGDRPHQPGRLRFCCVSCHDGYVTDRRYGLLGLYGPTSPGACHYCDHPVPANEQVRRLLDRAGV